MHADEAARTVSDRGQPRYADRGGIGGEQGLFRHDLADIAENGFLEFAPFGGRLDGEIHILEPADIGGVDDAVHRLVHFGLGDQVPCQLAIQVAPDGLSRRIKRVLGNIVEHNIVARQRAHMGNTIAHLARADNAYAFDPCHIDLPPHSPP